MGTEETKTQEETRKKIYAFIYNQIKQGTPRDEIIAKLTGAGLDQTQAEKLVSALEKQTQAQSEKEELTTGSIFGALAGGIVAAFGGGIVWGLIVKATGYEIGYMATGIGLLTGFAVVFFSDKRGMLLQFIAVVSALIGIGIGKYTAFYFVLKDFISIDYGEAAAGALSIFSSEVVSLFFMSLVEMVSFYDVLWIVLAIAAAWSIPRIRSLPQAEQSK